MGPENFAQIRPTGQKLRHFFEVTDARTDGHTDGQTFTNNPCTIGKIFFFFFFFFCKLNTKHRRALLFILYCLFWLNALLRINHYFDF